MSPWHHQIELETIQFKALFERRSLILEGGSGASSYSISTGITDEQGPYDAL